MSQAQRPAGPMRVGELLILAALWMLFGFMIWYYLSVFHGVPVRLVAERALAAVLGVDFYNLIPNPDRRFLLQVQTRIDYSFPDGSTGPLGFILNPLIYGYGLPLLFGLIMATNQPLLRKLLVLAGGYLVIAAVQVWGIFWESLKMLVFNFGGPARDVVLEAGVPENLVALCYQLGVLILPALAPVVVWMIGAWSEIEPWAATWTHRDG
ncbi:MAG: hypothetical protein P8008_04905 [Gammaproteobacteria bacterium]